MCTCWQLLGYPWLIMTSWPIGCGSRWMSRENPAAELRKRSGRRTHSLFFGLLFCFGFSCSRAPVALWLLAPYFTVGTNIRIFDLVRWSPVSAAWQTFWLPWNGIPLKLLQSRQDMLFIGFWFLRIAVSSYIWIGNYMSWLSIFAASQRSLIPWLCNIFL